MTQQPREAYHKDVREFRLAMIRDIPCRTRKQAKAFNLIRASLENNVVFIDQHPTAEILRLDIPGIEFSSRQVLANAHARIVTQLRVILETA
jgi:hypothetical protein